jgi:hypothetical protein
MYRTSFASASGRLTVQRENVLKGQIKGDREYADVKDFREGMRRDMRRMNHPRPAASSNDHHTVWAC